MTATFTLQDGAGTTVGSAFQGVVRQVSPAAIQQFSETLNLAVTHVLTTAASAGLARSLFAVAADGAKYLLMAPDATARGGSPTSVAWLCRAE